MWCILCAESIEIFNEEVENMTSSKYFKLADPKEIARVIESQTEASDWGYSKIARSTLDTPTVVERSFVCYPLERLSNAGV
jgi:hypothetical protein